MTAAQARERFAAARVARLATAGADGRPHVVPIVFAVAGDVIYSAVDAKPKRTTALRRLANVAANPAVAVLVDHYSDDWDELWWVRADGRGRVLGPGAPGSPDAPGSLGASGSLEAAEALALLADRYPQQRPTGAVLAIDVERWSGWSAR